MSNAESNSPGSITVTLLSSILSWITLFNAQYILSFILTCIGIISGVFAIRYYYYAGNERRNKLKNKFLNNKKQ